MSNDINVTDGTILESLNNKIDYDGGNYAGSGLETVVNNYLAENTSSGLDNKITNCITEIPQRIKYTLENGTLTIKAGSVVIVPYGTEDKTSQYPKGATFLNENFKVYVTQYSDGKFFVWVEVVNDIVSSPTSNGTLKRYINLDLTTNTISNVLQTESGTAATTQSYTYNYTGYYDTSKNLVGYAYNSTTITYSDVRSLHFMTTVADGTYAYGSMLQVFNGMGYIGSTIWLDKGVRGLAPNGRNEDGSLNNIEWTNNSLTTFTNTGTNKNSMYITYNSNSLKIGHAYPPYCRFDEINNRWLYNNTVAQMTVVGSYKESGTTGQVISEFEPKQPFRAVDYNDFAQTVDTVNLHNKAYITETYKNGTSWYRVWSDGWIEQGGKATPTSETDTYTLTFIKSFTTSNQVYVFTQANHKNTDGNAWTGVSLSRQMRNVYTITTTKATLQTLKEAFTWYACGY